MTDNEVKKYGIQQYEHVVDVVNTGRIFQGHLVYRAIWDEEYANKDLGLPLILLVKDEKIRRPMAKEIYQVLALVNDNEAKEDEDLAEKRRRILDEEKYVRPDGRTAEEIDRYIRELRDNDRI